MSRSPILKAFAWMAVAGMSAAMVEASFDHDFVHKYAELNLGSHHSESFVFEDSGDSINAFNRSLNIELPLGAVYPISAKFSQELVLRYRSNHWRWSEQAGTVTAAHAPSFLSAGVGWDLGFGRMIAPADNPYGLWIYEHGNGKISRFYNNFAGEAPVANVFYSHDDAKLRLQILEGGALLKVEFPNGELHEFRQQHGSWEISKRQDQFGNYLNYIYNYTANRLAIKDNYNRSYRVFFQDDFNGHPTRIITKIRLPKVGGGVYDFNFYYTNFTLPVPAEDNDPATAAQITVPVLTRIDRNFETYSEFTYYPVGDPGEGLLHQYTNAFGGRIDYEYEDVDLPYIQNPDNLSQSMDHFAADGIGVVSRTAFDFDGTQLGAWQLTTGWRNGTRNAPPSLDQPTSLTTTLFQPNGIKEERFFKSLLQNVDLTAPQVYTVYKSEYGSPGITNDWKSASVRSIWQNGVFKDLRRQNPTFACTACIDPDRVVHLYSGYASGDPLARKYMQDRNWAGRAGRIVESGGGAPVARVTTLTVDTSLPASHELWIDPAHTKVVTTEGSESKIEEQCVDSLGRITRTRKVRGASQAGNDFVSVHHYDASGNPSETEFFGGDDQSVPAGDLCSLSLGIPSFRRFATHTYGTLSGSGFLDASGNPLAEDFSAAIDLNTGLVVSRTAASGLTQTLTYDAIGRLTGIVPPTGHGQQHSKSYALSDGANGATETEKSLSNDGTTVLAERVVEFDGFGRVRKSSKRNAAGWAVTQKTYDAFGRVATETSADGGVTQYLNRDYKGRVGTKRPPEGSNHDMTYTYIGDSEVSYSVSISVDPSAGPLVEQLRTYTHTYDKYGRLVGEKITEQGLTLRDRVTAHSLYGHWLTKSEGPVLITNANQFDATGKLTQDSYGSARTYNALGQALEAYSAFGDRIDWVYDEAGRVTDKNLGSVNYVHYEYAAANSPGEFNKGRLVSARRYNPGVPDINDNFGDLWVTDTWEYKGKSGRVSSRKLNISDQHGTWVEWSTSATYHDNGMVDEFESSNCTSQNIFSCGSAYSQRFEHDQSFGKVTQIREINNHENLTWLTSATYSSEGHLTQYSFGNGLVTDVEYVQGSSIPERMWVKENGAVRWYSGYSFIDGRQNMTHLGSAQVLATDHYDGSSLQPQPTAYPVKPNGVDDYGTTTFEPAMCAGAYPPCRNIKVYNSQDQLVWLRNRPFEWPTSPIGLKTPSTLYVWDVLGRPSIINDGNASYWNDKQNYRITLTYSTNNFFSRRAMVYDGATPIGMSGRWGESDTFFHTDGRGMRVGSSDDDAVFTDSANIN